MPSGGSRCATGRDDIVPLKYTKVPAWIPPSAIKREALTTNIDSDDEELFRKVRGSVKRTFKLIKSNYLTESFLKIVYSIS